MGREARMVTPDWEHPQTGYKWENNYIPLRDNYQETVARFELMVREEGIEAALDWFDEIPDKSDYMLPDTDPVLRTHFMMYENTTEGTPISPIFLTPEELAHWLVDNNASSFCDYTATYEQWLRVCKGGYAPSLMFTPETGLVSGVEGIGQLEDKD